MIQNIHSDTSYLSEQNSRNRASGHYFMEWMPVANEPIKLNEAVRTLCKILKFVAASAAEAELGALLICIRVALDQLPLLSYGGSET